MELTLKMKIGDQEFTLVVNMTNKAGRIYRQKYSRDLVQDLTAINKKINPSIYDYVDISQLDIVNKTEEELNADLIRMAYPKYKEYTQNNVLDFTDTEQANQIIWAFAKNADDKLPDYEDWIDSFDFVMPVKSIIPVLFDAWTKTAQPIIELKN